MDMKRLEWMLGLKRKYDSIGDKKLCDFLDTLEGMTHDDFGNRICVIGEQPNILFSSHTDTVHWHKSKKTNQKIIKDPIKNEYFLDEKNGCLGADDGAGVFVLLNLMEAKIPGLYIFHRGEECGGLGSNYISAETPDLLKNINIAIAFDRKGQKDIITNQSCGKCASEEFAVSLAKQLGMGHSSARGSFTDTANYAGQIRECSNVSVGYENEHSPRETLNYKYLEQLIQNLLKVDWTKLEVKRETTDFGITPYNSYGGYGGYNYNRGGSYNRNSRLALYDEFLSMKEIQTLVELSPDVVAQILSNEGVTLDTVSSARRQINARKDIQTFDADFYGW